MKFFSRTFFLCKLVYMHIWLCSSVDHFHTWVQSPSSKYNQLQEEYVWMTVEKGTWYVEQYLYVRLWKCDVKSLRGTLRGILAMLTSEIPALWDCSWNSGISVFETRFLPFRCSFFILCVLMYRYQFYVSCGAENCTSYHISISSYTFFINSSWPIFISVFLK